MALFVVRFVVFPVTSFKSFDEQVEQAMYISTAAVASSTIVDMTALVLGGTWNGWGVASLVLWYCDAAFSVLLALLPIWCVLRAVARPCAFTLSELASLVQLTPSPPSPMACKLAGSCSEGIKVSSL